MLKRLIIGILKGLILGGGMAVALYMLAHIGSVSGFWGYLLYGVLGAITGVVAGKPLWKPGAWIEALLRGVFGIAVGCGLYALGAVVLTGQAIDFTALLGSLPADSTPARQLYQQPLIMAPMFATLYASLIELDNDGKGEDAGSTKVRVARLEDIDIGEDEAEAPAKPAARGAKR